MDERDFEILSVVNTYRNITKAAEALYVTQSALSKRISAIENELDTQILIRSRNGVYFTPEGEELLEGVEKVRKILQFTREKLVNSNGTISGNLTVGVSINYTLFRLPKVLAAYQQRFPNVTMHISSDNSRKLYNQLLQGRIELVIVRGEYPWKGKQVLISREKICAIKSRKNQDKDFSELNYIGRKTDLSYERELVQWFHENNIDLTKQTAYVDNLTACVELVKAANSWTIVPEICLDQFDGEIYPLTFEDGSPFVRSTYLIYSQAVGELPQVREFINLIKELSKEEEL
ncbi:LysR family transcriptional regulator [Aerococcaceae bacterium WGS1372]